MNTTKKIIALAIILGLAILSFILFGSKMNNNTASTTASSVMSKASEVMSSAMTMKDNKTIELAPKDLTIWSSGDVIIDAQTVIPEGFTGINGSKSYQSPQAGDNVNYVLGVVNATFQQSPIAKTELDAFKAVTKLNSNPNNDNFYKFKSPFRSINEVGGYSKVYLKDVTYTKPSNFDTLRVVITKDGQSGELIPTVNLLGNRGNDYFLLENRLADFKSGQEYQAAINACVGSTVDKCVDTKYQDAIDLYLSQDLITSKIDQAIAVLN
jgi:hypothetical protein